MKKLLSLVLVLILAMGLFACGNTGAPSITTPAANTPSAPATQAPAESQDAGQSQEPEITWPNGDITLYIPSQVGSATDVNARTMADWIAMKTGVDVVCENDDVGGGANLADKLIKAAPDGQTLMFVGMANITSYYSGTWTLNPADPANFSIACGTIQPDPDSGCIILTQPDQPYSNWEELANYIKEHPGEVTVASVSSSVMDIKLRALFNYTGLSEQVRYVSTSRADSTTGLLGGNINLVIMDEATASNYILDGSAKGIVNCRVNEDFSVYEGDINKAISAVETLTDILGDKADAAMVPNRTMIVGPAGMSDELIKKIAAIVDTIVDGDEEWQARLVANGGTSYYRTWDPQEVRSEWARLDPIVAEIKGAATNG